MRAYMSDRSERSERTVDAGTMGDLGVAWNALAEARAILAETEPEYAPDTEQFWERINIRLPQLFPNAESMYVPNVAAAALVESLTRFVKAEV